MVVVVVMAVVIAVVMAVAELESFLCCALRGNYFTCGYYSSVYSIEQF